MTCTLQRRHLQVPSCLFEMTKKRKPPRGILHELGMNTVLETGLDKYLKFEGSLATREIKLVIVYI